MFKYSVEYRRILLLKFKNENESKNHGELSKTIIKIF